MLNRLYIKNIALIDEANITFDSRFNVLSGETGAGKSIILDSINFVLGSKADKNLIRYGQEEALVKAEFIIDEKSQAAALLNDMDIDCDGVVVISRRLSVSGKGSIKINGNTVTATMLKSVTSRLVDVHGQSEHFYLLNEKNQLNLIDSLCADDIQPLREKLSSEIAERRNILSSIEELGGDEQERARKLDLLDYQIKEISEAEVRVGEFEELSARKKVMDNIEKIAVALNEVKTILNDDNGCIDQLSVISRSLDALSSFGDEYSALQERAENLSVEAEDLSETITDLCEGLSYDESEAVYVDARIDLLKKLMRKYGSGEEAVLSYLAEAERQYEALNDASASIEMLRSKLSDTEDSIYATCLALTARRKECCNQLCIEVVKELTSLNIQNAKFEVKFKEYDRQSVRLNDTNGSDDICFMFSANKGEPLKPLSNIISGGEMSRLMLAVKTQLKNINGISTYIFDEIDAGISGVTARAVAEKFIAISKNTQIIAVSHLPQVCAAANSQYLISKVEEGGNTFTRIKPLSPDERVTEIVRLTGGTMSEAAVLHARELLEYFGN